MIAEYVSKVFMRTFSNLGSFAWNTMSKSCVVRTLAGSDQDADWQSVIEEACDKLKADKLVAVPTDTIYGIAGLAQSRHAVNALYAVKGRDGGRPLSICVGDVEDVTKWGNVTISKPLLSELLPGPVTVVFERKLDLSPYLNPGHRLVGIRVPNYGFVRDLARMCKEPLALTSANLSSQPSTLRVEEFCHMWSDLDLVIDGGCLSSSDRGSTVIDLSEPGFYQIIRKGSAHSQTLQTLRKYGLTPTENH